LPSIAQAVSADTFQLGCTPIVNLFERSAETIRVSHTVTEYPVIPDRLRLPSMEVYSVDRVTSTAAYGEEPLVYEPFYSFRHAYGEPHTGCFWYAHRRLSPRKDDAGTEVYLSLVDLDFKPALAPVELLTAWVTCTNRDFVSRLPWRKEWGELEGEGLPLVQARCLVPPTNTLRPPLRGSLQWRLISHLSLNHLSIVQAGGGEALQEILRLYAFYDDEDIRRRITGIAGLQSEIGVSPVSFASGVAFCRGLDVEILFDEAQFAGSGVFLLAAVLERFLGLYSAVNSYSRLTARSRQRNGILKRWPPRIGQQRVL
jgi:type VI secretion system protein ImpG